MRSRNFSLSKRAFVALASCLTLAALVVLATRIGATRVDRAVGPLASAIPAPQVSTEDATERSARTPIAPRGRIDGTIVDVHGTPIDPSGGFIELRGPADSVRLSTWGLDASFAFEALLPGRWTVRVVAPNRVDAIAQVELSAPDGTGRADVVLQRVRTVPVRIVDSEGRPLAAALAANDLRPAHAGRIEVHVQGQTLVPRAARAFIEVGGGSIPIVEGSSPRLRLMIGTVLLDEVRPEEGATEIVLTADVERIRAYAAWITFEVPEPAPRSTTVTVRFDGREDQVIRIANEDRVARIGVEPGRVVIQIAAEGQREMFVRCVLAPGETHALGMLALEPECILRGVVRTDDGRPVGGPVLVRQRADNPSRPDDPFRVVADVNGRFIVRGLGTGSYTVWCEWGGPAVRVELPQAADLELVGQFPAPDRQRQGKR